MSRPACLLLTFEFHELFRLRDALCLLCTLHPKGTANAAIRCLVSP